MRSSILALTSLGVRFLVPVVALAASQGLGIAVDRLRNSPNQAVVLDGSTAASAVYYVAFTNQGLQFFLNATRIPFLRGDPNDDGTVDISDTVLTLGVLFLGQGAITCEDAADSNDDGIVDISDAVASLGVLFLGQGEIPLPGMNDCGPDPTPDELGCEEFIRCNE